jgi:DNA-binding transcriptional MerR regulator/mannose-6-phosphate isomerase-like protein (cupin superfamily)
MGRNAEGTRPAAAGLLGAVGIEEAARRVGASPSALREWERQGLVRPARTAGGARRYLADDVERLQRIRAWRTVDGLNAAAIRRLLDRPRSGSEPASGGRHRDMVGGGPLAPEPALDPTAGAADAAAGPAGGFGPWPAGSQLRAIRRSKGLTLRAAATTSGLSASFISSLERGVTGASLAALRRLLEAYGQTVADLLAGDAPESGRLVRPAERRVLDAGRGIKIEDLFAVPTALESQLFVLAPGASSDGYYRHVGEEFMFVLEGSLGVWLDGPHEFYRLEPGDALTFPSTVDHRIAALGQVETRVLWINTPPTF